MKRRLLAYGGSSYVSGIGRWFRRRRRPQRCDHARGGDDVLRLLAVKDEYEVARLHTDPAFRAALEAQFEGTAGQDFTVKFNMAPPVLSKAKNGGQPRKMTFGQWLWPVLGMLSKVRGLRGTVIDPFGKSLERKMERELAAITKSLCRRALEALTPDNAKDVETLALLHERIRGYGHVKLANLSMVKRRERDLGVKLGIEVSDGAAVRLRWMR